METKRVERVAVRKLWWAALVAAVAAFVGDVIVLVIAEDLLSLSVTVQVPPQYQILGPLDVAGIAWATVPPAIGATILLAILGRFTRRPFLIFQITAAVSLLLSFGGPLSLPVSEAVKIVLGLIHIVAAGAIVGVLSTL
ncbi:MAG TPA: DUF6069 family protein, partial [Thermoleophilia bacterium]|nr:DUF6069 family protein [Thermoleophilia bacterium]